MCADCVYVCVFVRVFDWQERSLPHFVFIVALVPSSVASRMSFLCPLPTGAVDDKLSLGRLALVVRLYSFHVFLVAADLKLYCI